jgi:hypothetical protein
MNDKVGCLLFEAEDGTFQVHFYVDEGIENAQESFTNLKAARNKEKGRVSFIILEYEGDAVANVAAVSKMLPVPHEKSKKTAVKLGVGPIELPDENEENTE